MSRVEALIPSAEVEGAKVVPDGRGNRPEKFPNGNFVSDHAAQVDLLFSSLS